MKKNLALKLCELGLGDKEALLYCSAIKLGPATAQNLSLESGIKRATVYSCLNALIEKGLFHIEIKGTRKLYVPEAPNKLEMLLEQKKQLLQEMMPQLMNSYMNCQSTTNAIKIYHGISKIKLLYDHMLDSLAQGDEYLVISDQQKWLNLDPLYFENFMLKRAAKNLDIKVILQDNEQSRAFKLKEEKYNEKIKFLPKNINLNTNMVILPSKVIIIQTIEPLLAILIENMNVAQMNKVLFHTIWELS
ncbi:MAG: TrmB family transcriptional regulator [Candidatus Berkiella sp.]